MINGLEGLGQQFITFCLRMESSIQIDYFRGRVLRRTMTPPLTKLCAKSGVDGNIGYVRCLVAPVKTSFRYLTWRSE